MVTTLQTYANFHIYIFSRWILSDHQIVMYVCCYVLQSLSSFMGNIVKTNLIMAFPVFGCSSLTVWNNKYPTHTFSCSLARSLTDCMCVHVIDANCMKNIKMWLTWYNNEIKSHQIAFHLNFLDVGDGENGAVDVGYCCCKLCQGIKHIFPYYCHSQHGLQRSNAIRVGYITAECLCRNCN